MSYQSRDDDSDYVQPRELWQDFKNTRHPNIGPNAEKWRRGGCLNGRLRDVDSIEAIPGERKEESVKELHEVSHYKCPGPPSPANDYSLLGQAV
jgi:hypothetical protein